MEEVVEEVEEEVEELDEREEREEGRNDEREGDDEVIEEGEEEVKVEVEVEVVLGTDAIIDDGVKRENILFFNELILFSPWTDISKDEIFLFLSLFSSFLISSSILTLLCLLF